MISRTVLAITIFINIKLITILIKNHALTFRLYILLFILPSLQIIYVSSVNQISFTVTENCAKNYIVGDMALYGAPNNSTSSTKIYSMESMENDQFKELFIINPQDGLIRVNRAIDREIICPQLSSTSGTCSVTLLVTILNDIFNIVIIIVDENDNSPSFLLSTVTISIKESSPIGTKMYLTHAKDMDSLYNGIGDYSLTSERGGNTFQLKYNFSVIYLESIQNLDFEICDLYRLTLSVCDLGSPRLCTSQNIKIIVIDVNDNYPTFTKPKYLAIINEDHAIGKEVLQLNAVDKDSRLYGLVRYRFSSINNEAKMWFRLDSITGKIYLIRSLVIKIRNFKFIVEAYDNGHIPNVNRTLVSVHVKDINNHSPEIKIRKSTFPTTITVKGQDKSEVAFYENNPKNTDVVFVVVTDEDTDENGLVQCVMDQNEGKLFQLEKFNWNRNKVIYRLVVLHSANCEDKKRYVMTVNCTDSGEKPKITIRIIEVTILDINEYYARFNQTTYSASIREDIATFGIAMPIIDEDCNIDFSIEIIDQYARDHFKYVMTTQHLVLISKLDFEEKSVVKFLVKIIDKGSDSKILSSTSTVEITVIDINDNAPVLIEPRNFYIAEDARIGATVGQLKANDSDQNQNAKIQFQKIKILSKGSTSSEFNSFFITSEGAIKLAKELDREKQELYLLTVEVTDMGTLPLSSTDTVTITVTDINDNTPQWVFPNKNDNKINESVYSSEGAVITRVHAMDIDGVGNNNISYHLIRENSKDFFLHPIKGELSFLTTPRVGIYKLDILALDNGKPLRSNKTKLIIFVSEKAVISSSSDFNPSRSYFTIVAVVPVLILICVLMLILCLLLIVRRRNARTKNRRNQLKNKNSENILRKTSNLSHTKMKLLSSNMMEMHPVDGRKNNHQIESLDLTQTQTLPKVSYQCLVANDLDVCSADSGQGASEEDFSNYFMLKSNESYRTAPCNQHCCSPLPENSIAHFICSTINHPILYSQSITPYKDDSTPFSYNIAKSSPSSSNPQTNSYGYKISCVNSSCKRP